MNSSTWSLRVPVRLLAILGLSTCAVSAQQTRLLTVGSMPYEQVSIAANPADLNGASDGLSNFTRQYADGSVVNLVAPAADGPHTFVKWRRDGVDFTTNPVTTLTMDADHVMTAVYSANIPPPVTDVLVNGSFENGFNGWTANGNVALGNNPASATDGSAWALFNGGQNPPNGVVSQTFATEPGRFYTLAFDVGVFSFKKFDQKLQFQVMGATERLSGIETLNGVASSQGVLQWFSEIYGFTADSATSTLTFTDISPTSDALDLYLDHVRVSGAIDIPPVAVDDSMQIHAGQKALIPVLANDLGIMDQGTVEVVSPPATGTASVQPSGKILYAHAGGGNSPVTFTYRVSGEGGNSDPATVTIAIASTLRIPSDSIKLPAEPPATAVQVVPAFPGVVFDEPLAIVSTPDDTSRLFVCERGGKIKVIPDVTAASATSSLVLDLAQAVANPARVPLESWDGGNYEESGLMGMAFHPDFAVNGHFYVSYLVEKSNDTTANVNGRIFPVLYQRLSRFTIPPAQIGQPAPVADPASELVLIEQRDRDDGHNCSDLHFGDDGYLYWGIGDETNPNDFFGNSQRIDMNFFAALLRIDVDKRPGNLEPNPHPNPAAASLGYSAAPGIPRDEFPVGSGIFRARYSIPIDNPFVPISAGGSWNGTFNGSAVGAASLPYVRSEFWAVGLRSPWRFHFDRPTGEIWLGDVGQDKYEELNLITSGGNYGWAFRDGAHSGPKSPPPGFVSTAPVYEYLHTSQPGGNANLKGNAVIGGVVYRGGRFASLDGAYIFGDHISGNIWALRRPGGVVTVERIAGQQGITTFGTDPSNGDVLLTDYYNGRIMRIVTATPDSSFPTTLSATGLFADLTDLSPAPGLLPYQPNLKFWSDHAEKRRWFAIPDPAAKMTWSRDTPWTFPSGQVWVKHFDLESERGNPASPKIRIETRVLVKNDSGTYGVSYRWNGSGTEATLVEDSGESFPVDITVDGAPYTQQWTIPSRSQCLTCHTPQAGHALSFNTPQLNLTNPIHGFTGNQLDLLHDAGYLHNTPESPNLLPRHLRPDETQYPLEARVRSYLAVNCAYCHAGDDGTAPPAWDGRYELTLEQTGLINGESSLAGGDFKLIVPGDTAHSVVLQRIGATGGFTRMPPLGTNEIDPQNIALLTDWINLKLPGRLTYADWREQVFGSTTSPEGEPGEDADGDGFSNHDEFLAGTLATSGTSFLLPSVTRTEGQVSLAFEIPENRSVRAETSGNLADWSLWDIPSNNGVAQPGGPTIFSGPAPDPQRFYRLLIRER